jgi:hypothetical protein
LNMTTGTLRTKRKKNEEINPDISFLVIKELVSLIKSLNLQMVETE